MISENTKKMLEEKAVNVMRNAHVPYSNYQVGAALLTEAGKIYTGCNIENHGIMSICAERVAFCKALSEGERKFTAIYVVAGKCGGERELTTPCGYCRQFMTEFVNRNFTVIIGDGKNEKEFTIEELLPESFKLEEY